MNAASALSLDAMQQPGDLEVGHAHFWLLPPDQVRSLAANAAKILPHFDWDSGPLARNTDSRRLWEGRQTALRLILAGELNEEPAHLRFGRDKWGKPHLLDHPETHFSVSSSEGWWLAAVSNDEVGVDLEVIRPWSDLEAVAKTYFNEAELACLEAAPDAVERLRCFYRAWTRKEALLKLKGQGISGLAALREQEAQGIWLEDLPLAPGLAASLALPQAPLEIMRRSMDAAFKVAPDVFRNRPENRVSVGRRISPFHSRSSMTTQPATSSAYRISEIGGEEAERLRKQAAIFLSQELPAFLESFPSNGCFLDLGCGVGVLADAVASARPEAHVYGYDLDELASEKSRANFGSRPNLNFGCRSIEQGPPKGFPGADAAVLRLVLMHSPNPVAALRAARSWIKPGGILHVVEMDDRALGFDPLPEWMPGLLDLMQEVQIRKGGSRHLGREMAGLLENAGWRVSGRRELSLDPSAAVAALPKVFLPVAENYLGEAERLGIGSTAVRSHLCEKVTRMKEGHESLTKIKVPLFHVWGQQA